MKVQDVITQVRATTGDVSAMQFSDAMLLNWINNGVRQCAVDNNLLQKKLTGVTVVGQADYDAPIDILKFHSITYNGNKLKEITLQEWQEQYSGVGQDITDPRGTPDVCYFWAGKLTLFPIPDTVNPLVMNYIYTPVAYTSGMLDVEIGLPVGFHSRIIDYCIAQVALQDDNLDLYNIKMAEFNTGVQQLLNQSNTTQDLYPSISVSSRDMGDDWQDGYYG